MAVLGVPCVLIKVVYLYVCVFELRLYIHHIHY